MCPQRVNVRHFCNSTFLVGIDDSYELTVWQSCLCHELRVVDELLVEGGPAEVRPPQRRLYQSPVPDYAITCRSKVLACQLRNMY